MNADTAPSAKRRGAVAIVLAAAAAGRVAHLAAVADAPFVAQLALDSQEYDRWAREIAAGNVAGTAPFFQAPLYPYLVALLYRVLSDSPIVVYLAQVAAAVGACAALIACGRRLGGERVGLAAGILFALYTPFWFYDAQLLKESFAVSLVALLLWLLVLAREGTTARARRTWLAAGVVAGLLALLRENMLLVVPFLVPLALFSGETPKNGRRARWVQVALFLAGVALPLLPVAMRNAALGGGFLPTTSQGGVNFWIGNNPEADGTYLPLVPGKQVPAYEREEARRLAEQASGRKLAAWEVSRFWLSRSLAWAADRPADFLRLQARKLRLYFSGYEWPDAVDYYWMKTISPPLALPLFEFLGVVLLAFAGTILVWRERASWSPVLLFELAWLITTVAFFLFARYRLPALPGLLLLAAVPLVRAWELWRSRRKGVALVATAAVAVAVAAPHLAGYRPRLDLVEFNLGRMAEERGEAEAARRHYEAALHADPRSYSATLNLGNLAARSRDYEAARTAYERALAIEPGADDARANLGGVLLALGDLEGARRELDRALALNPENRFALHNRALLDKRVAEGAASPPSAGERP